MSEYRSMAVRDQGQDEAITTNREHERIWGRVMEMYPYCGKRYKSVMC